ncbi:carbohydrate kinase [Geitlerinema sp. PCC 9228]|jgi:fructokinase|uniref:carbohydrate kinase family protein n=1 Tax=Geitlerinema sp. PCC 9228 TaxID=111611 RepID=UPI0008F9C385|nr:carbohydrate kinase [Geitlerinema sp. PCC 9228]
MNNPSPRVLCLGEVLFDLLADQVGQNYEQVTSWTPYPGGAPANVAAALVKLGTPAGFVGCVGSDDSGNELVELLKTTGVNIQGVQRHQEAPTRKIYVVRTNSGDREFAGFGGMDSAAFADTHLDANALDESLFEMAEFLVLGTLELPYDGTRGAIEKALQLAEKYDLKIVLDVNWRPMFWPNPEAAPQAIQHLIEYADFLKLSAEEAQWLFDTQDPGAIKYRLNSVDGVLVTSGEHGAAYCLGENEDKIPAFAVKAVDTTGSGDGFLAGLIHQLCQKGIHSLEDAATAKQVVTYACAVGALTATKPGAIASQPMPSEVEAFLAENPPN